MTVSISTLKQFLFISAILFELIYVLLFALTIKLPTFRFWPPPSARSWQFFFSWLLASLVAINFLFIGLLDFNSAFLDNWLRFPIGVLLHVIGTVIGSWSFNKFGLRATIGLGDQLITDGPYRYSRNPQYIADCINILAFMLITNSWMVWMIGILGVILNLMAPFTEEPWLADRFGEAYLQYKQTVPRFIGRS